jgi:uncharacterized protein
MTFDDGRFEWDEDKAAINLDKHGVSFEEARGAFNDPFALEIFDDEHSENEPRYQLIGLSGRRLLLVAFAERGKRKRIIHARKATQSMEELYVEKNS